MNLNFGSTLMMIRWGPVMIFLFLFFTSRVIQSLTPPPPPPPPRPLEHTRIVRFSTAFIIII